MLLLSELLSRLKQAQIQHLKQFEMPANKLCLAVLCVIQEEGFIQRYFLSGINVVVIIKERNQGNYKVLQDIALVSKSSRRVYVSAQTLWKLHKGLGTYVVSTSRGVISDREARFYRIGGEVLCRIK